MSIFLDGRSNQVNHSQPETTGPIFTRLCVIATPRIDEVTAKCAQSCAFHEWFAPWRSFSEVSKIWVPKTSKTGEWTGSHWSSGVCLPSLPGLVNVNKKRTGKIHHAINVNQLFLWPFSIVMLNYQRVSIVKYYKLIWYCLISFYGMSCILFR